MNFFSPSVRLFQTTSSCFCPCDCDCVTAECSHCSWTSSTTLFVYVVNLLFVCVAGGQRGIKIYLSIESLPVIQAGWNIRSYPDVKLVSVWVLSEYIICAKERNTFLENVKMSLPLSTWVISNTGSGKNLLYHLHRGTFWISLNIFRIFSNSSKTQ